MATPKPENKETQALAVTDSGTKQLYHTPEAEQFQMEQRMAKLFVQSGLFADITGTTLEQAIAQAYVKIALGRSMGFSASESMQGIDIIKGKPAVSAQLRGARMQRAGFSWKIDRLDDHGCELTIHFNGSPIGQANFVERDAQLMGLLGKDNWKRMPSDMYFARAITRGQKRYAPGVLSADIMSREEVFDMPSNDLRIEPAMPRRISEVAQMNPEIVEQVTQPADEGAADGAPEQLVKYLLDLRAWRETLGDPFFLEVLRSYRSDACPKGFQALSEVTADAFPDIQELLMKKAKKAGIAAPEPTI